MAEDRVGSSIDEFGTNLCLSIQNVVEQLEPMAAATGIRFETQVEGDLSVDIDPARLELLCKNLLINAVQHSFPTGVISIIIEQVDDSAQMRIMDVGEGIDPRDIPHIFERFSRSDPSRSRKTGGSGLGLAICKAVAQMFNGSIEINSQLNTGTTVLVKFPLVVREVAPVPSSNL
jgi:signal transduction histidine kinase